MKIYFLKDWKTDLCQKFCRYYTKEHFVQNTFHPEYNIRRKNNWMDDRVKKKKMNSLNNQRKFKIAKIAYFKKKCYLSKFRIKIVR